MSRYAATAAGRDAATWTSNISKMRTYAAFLTVVAAAAAPFRHRGRDKVYWNVEDPDRLYGPLGAEPFEALSVACKRTAARLTRATATEESFEDAGACLDALVARGKLGAAYYDVVPLLSVRALQYHAYGYAADGLMSRLEALRSRMDPGAARPAETQETIDAAVASYSLGARSGRTSVRAFAGPNQQRGDKCPGQVSKPNASASLHVHHHMTFHGGTTLVGIFHHRTCALSPTCVEIKFRAPHAIDAGVEARGGLRNIT